MKNLFKSILVVLAMNSCAQQGLPDKNYYICTEDKYKGIIADLVKDFNKDMGAQFLYYSCHAGVNVNVVNRFDKKNVLGRARWEIKDGAYTAVMFLKRSMLEEANYEAIKQVFYHEVGHVFNLDHTDGEHDLMNEYQRTSYDLEHFKTLIHEMWNTEIYKD